jgi:hypothetical protein
MSDTRLEYHEIREVFAEFNERMNPHVACKLADLARQKSEAAYEQGHADGCTAQKSVYKERG